MYWNVRRSGYGRRNRKINSNMRCIETILRLCFRRLRSWLIVTWDVLKHDDREPIHFEHWRLIVTWDVLKLRNETSTQRWNRINSNMRCIETAWILKIGCPGRPINSNMRCIETSSVLRGCYIPFRLIVTWDVLKPELGEEISECNYD